MMFFFSFRGATLEDREIVLSVSYGYHQIVQIRSQEFGRTVLKLIDTGVVRPSTQSAPYICKTDLQVYLPCKLH